jgi:uncharacterized protein
MAMELDNTFTVPVPPEQAWDVLLDVKRIAPCMPGATVDEVEGDVVNGHIKVKVGPVSLTYRGTATFTERDADAHTIVVEAAGKETRGAGTASATVRASLEPDASGNGTLVTMHTTMNVTGRPAQFGRGVMVEVGGKLVDQFAANLATQIAGGGTAAPAAANGGQAATAAGGTQSANGTGTAAAKQDGAGPATESTATESTATESTAIGVTVTAAPPPPAAQADSINLVRLVGPAILKRVLPIAAIVAALAFLGRRLWRRSKGEDKA